MAKPGPQPKVDVEEAFVWWFNNGDRRTYVEVAQRFGVHYDTVRRYADEYDWDGRADEIDEETRRQLGKRLASRMGKMHAASIEIAGTAQARFVRRLQLPPEDPNAIRPQDLTLNDMLTVARLVEMSVGRLPEATREQHEESLAEIERQIAALDMAEVEEGGRSEHVQE